MAQAKVEIFLDLGKYSRVMADKLAQRVNVEVRNRARYHVAVDTSRLRNSIRTEKLGSGHYQTLSETPYSLAQEFGRPDLPRYTFTPYMRPAAQEAVEPGKLKQFVSEAEEAAMMRAKK